MGPGGGERRRRGGLGARSLGFPAAQSLLVVHRLLDTLPDAGRSSRIPPAESGDARDEILVWCDKGSVKRYRFSVDDNIEFLKDLGDATRLYDEIWTQVKSK